MSKSGKSYRKIGTGHAAGMARQGAREARAVLYPESNVAQPTDYGIWGVATPGEAAESRRDDGRELEEEKDSVLGERLQQAIKRDDPGRDDRSMERD